MTPEMFVFVVVLLVVKYTLEFADRRRWREKRRRRRVSRPRASAPRMQAAHVTPPPQPPAEAPAPTGDPFWDMVTARIAAQEERD